MLDKILIDFLFLFFFCHALGVRFKVYLIFCHLVSFGIFFTLGFCFCLFDFLFYLILIPCVNFSSPVCICSTASLPFPEGQS